jgi:hypothetical protein
VRRRGGLRGDGRCAWRTCMYAVSKVVYVVGAEMCITALFVVSFFL